MTHLELAGQTITEVVADFTVALHTSGGYEIRIETAFGLQDAAGAVREHVPGEPGVDVLVEALKGDQVAETTVDDFGVLSLAFDSGRALRATPDEDYEAWTVAGPGGLKVVCLPGGELASWSPQESQ